MRTSQTSPEFDRLTSPCSNVLLHPLEYVGLTASLLFPFPSQKNPGSFQYRKSSTPRAAAPKSTPTIARATMLNRSLGADAPRCSSCRRARRVMYSSVRGSLGASADWGGKLGEKFPAGTVFSRPMGIEDFLAPRANRPWRRSFWPKCIGEHYPRTVSMYAATRGRMTSQDKQATEKPTTYRQHRRILPPVSPSLLHLTV